VSVVHLLGLFLSILAPVVGVWMAKLAKDRLERDHHKEVDDADASIQTHLQGDPRGLAELSRQFERLQREVARKRGHTR